MIDTIVLTLNPDQFSILDHNRFNPSTVGLFQPPYYRLGSCGNFKCVQNPTKEELVKGLYKPRLTVIKRFQAGAWITLLKVEFSIPKMIFSNNFDEVDDTHSEEVIRKLGISLESMGILVFPQAIRNASVSTVHYSKNIPLTDYSTPSLILEKLSKINLNETLDLNQTDFRNGGHCLKFRANSFEVALYDKRKDLQKAKISDKRAIERDNAIQLDLFENWNPKAPFEVLRLEVRLNKRSKIKEVFEKNNIPPLLTFASIFKKAPAQKILLHYLEKIKRGYALLSYQPQNGHEFINDFRARNPKIKIRKMLQAYAIKKLTDEMGIRSFRQATKSYGPHNWDRLKNDLETLHFANAPFEALIAMDTSLKRFEPLRLENYKESSLT